jgi:putative acetyltransferase
VTPLIRDARDDDAAALIALIRDSWAPYAGCIVDVDGEMSELRAVASRFAAGGGRFWVAEGEGRRLVGSAGVLPAARPSGMEIDNAMEIHKLNVAPALRRYGLATRLVALVEDEARARGAAFLELHTDLRFVAAHRFYERHGYIRQPGMRIVDDRSRSVEYCYVKPLAADP